MTTTLPAAPLPVRAPGGSLSSSSPFAAFFEQQWSDVLGFACSLTGDRHTGEEVAQEAFARVCARFPLLREPRPYVFRTATNLARDAAKRRRREEPEPDLGAVARLVQVDVHLLDAVHRLPPKLTEVVLLHYYADLSVDEIGAVLRRPRGTVGRQLSEARTALALALGGTRD